jgi:hypothetical protein
MQLTIDQQKFYEHLQQSHPIFFDKKDNESHPDLAHLKTPPIATRICAKITRIPSGKEIKHE